MYEIVIYFVCVTLCCQNNQNCLTQLRSVSTFLKQLLFVSAVSSFFGKIIKFSIPRSELFQLSRLQFCLCRRSCHSLPQQEWLLDPAQICFIFLDKSSVCFVCLVIFCYKTIFVWPSSLKSASIFLNRIKFYPAVFSDCFVIITIFFLSRSGLFWIFWSKFSLFQLSCHSLPKQPYLLDPTQICFDFLILAWPS